nr:methyltransferase-like protein 27 [Ciona intestinalis]|eukprot:XP_002129813.1 methyltransferase-like protein 27 [Ciona intestinalis]
MSADDQKYKQLYNKIYGTYIDVSSTENTVSNYTTLAKDYETDFVGLGYETPRVIAQTALELIQDQKNSKFLDIACGTGLVAQELRKSGFKGGIDGIDGSAGMLELAKPKNLYSQLKEAFIYPGIDMPFENNAYMGVVCSGGFGPGHLDPKVLVDLIRVCVSGGVIVFATRFNAVAGEYVSALNKEIERLEENGLWKKVKNFTTTYFDYDFSNQEDPTKSEPLLASIHCYKKM